MRQTAEYVKQAIEAEARATQLEDKQLKKHWLEIANGYRNLAQARLMFIEATSNQPLPALKAARRK